MFDVYAKSNKLFRDCAVTKEQSSEEGVRANSVIFINVCYVCVRVIYMRMCNRVSVRASVWKRASGGSGGESACDLFGTFSSQSPTSCPDGHVQSLFGVDKANGRCSARSTDSHRDTGLSYQM